MHNLHISQTIRIAFFLIFSSRLQTTKPDRSELDCTKINPIVIINFKIIDFMIKFIKLAFLIYKFKDFNQ
jgi:hypothetical protein